MTGDEHTSLDSRQIRRSFERAASDYDTAAALQREVGDRMLERLGYVRLQPSRILDLGAGTGHCAQALLRRYQQAQIVALDLALAMTRLARARRVWWRRPLAVCADARSLPFGDGRFNLVISNLMLQWCAPVEDYFAEIRRVLRADGLFMFTSFGPHTLRELRQAWAGVDSNPHVHVFPDMHDVGDALVRAGFADPVMDMEMMTVTYAQLLDLLHDLKTIGARNAASTRALGLTGRATLNALRTAYEAFRDDEGRLPASYEVIFGHAWAPDAPAPSPSPKQWIPLRSIGSPIR